MFVQIAYTLTMKHESEVTKVFAAYPLPEQQVRQTLHRLSTTRELEFDTHLLLSDSALLLELLVLGGVFLEINPTTQTFPDFERRIEAQLALKVKDLLNHAAKYDVPLAARSLVVPSLEDFTRSVRSILELCPIEWLEQIGHEQQLEPLSYRCRRAYDALTAFVFRVDRKSQPRLQLVGSLYAKGEISLTQAAVLLELKPSDAIALLEQANFVRDETAIVLDETERLDLLSQIRAERLARQGTIHFDPDLLYRDVIASERIENIDVRPLLPRIEA
jgi:hypothetical protein